jgi:hypothetical protein
MSKSLVGKPKGMLTLRREKIITMTIEYDRTS